MRLRQYSHLLFVLPALLVYGVFVIYPTLSAFWLSLFDWSGVGTSMNFVGLANFVEALSSPEVYRAGWHNLLFFLAIFAFQNTVGLFVAIQLDARPRFVEFYRTVLFMPVLISLVATGFIWSLMLSPNIGVINPLLKDLGLGWLARPWLSSNNLALPIVIGVQAWQMLGWSIVIYLAGLQGIPQELREAAQIDGATSWNVFRHVVFPLLAPSVTILSVLTFILIFRVFDVVYVLAGPAGAPAGATDVLGTLIYRNAFGSTGAFAGMSLRMSYAIAVSVIIMVLLGLQAAVLLFGLRRREVQT
ncbi:carbohydrate ABC transporter permease [Chloroflexota bacterium]